ncbi:Protein kinase, AMP-activated, beta [Chytridiales sp. JEL 0842]|nr:Protein kinase, AMP-activated, beta [Chytridiales sp. JEL 0842]
MAPNSPKPTSTPIPIPNPNQQRAQGSMSPPSGSPKPSSSLASSSRPRGVSNSSNLQSAVDVDDITFKLEQEKLGGSSPSHTHNNNQNNQNNNNNPSTKDPPSLKPLKNSSKIVHAFGPGGIAPLAPLSHKKDDKSVIPVMISWGGGGRTVHVTGTFNNWKQKIRLTKSKADFTTVVDMPAGQTHRFKFIVDDEWKCSEDLPMASDPDGNLVNYLDVFDERGEGMGDGLDSLAVDVLGQPMHTTLSESPPSSYTSKIPGYLNWHLQPPPPPPSSSSPSFQPLRPEPPPLPNENPPLLPPHLEKVLLNTSSSSSSSTHPASAAATALASSAYMQSHLHSHHHRDDNSVLPLPSQVTLNHLYACSIRDGVMALACTGRYREKFVTTVLYKPVVT